MTIPANYWVFLQGIESGNNPHAKAKTSSASGLYQFTRSTWLGEGGTWGTDMTKPFGGLNPTPEEQTARVKTLTAKNVGYLEKAGLPINTATLYAAHFFGPAVAARVLASPGSAHADALAGSLATTANLSILKGKTVQDFKNWLKAKTGVTT